MPSFPGDRVPRRPPDALTGRTSSELRPPTVLYVHLHEAALTGSDTGVARCEGIGPLPLTQLADLLGHAHVDREAGHDLDDHVRSRVRTPRRAKERVRLVTDGDWFPHAAGLGRKVDFDHPTPYDDHGPPGQTGTHNSGPLGRRHHRWQDPRRLHRPPMRRRPLRLAHPPRPLPPRRPPRHPTASTGRRRPHPRRPNRRGHLPARDHPPLRRRLATTCGRDGGRRPHVSRRAVAQVLSRFSSG